MKNLLLLLVFLGILASCSMPKPMYTMNAAVGDYTYLIEQGFFVSKYHDNLKFDYIEIGEIIIEARNGHQTAKAVITPGNTSSTTHVKTEYTDYKVATLEDSFQKLYEVAKEKGANGIIDLKVTPISSSEYNTNSKKSYGAGYYITGQLIRINK